MNIWLFYYLSDSNNKKMLNFLGNYYRILNFPDVQYIQF